VTVTVYIPEFKADALEMTGFSRFDENDAGPDHV